VIGAVEHCYATKEFVSLGHLWMGARLLNALPISSRPGRGKRCTTE
jgi:hypothetical protein